MSLMSQLPSATIIISTLDRLPQLRRLLDALGHLDDDDFEVVVVVGPTADGTAAYLAASERPLKVVHCPDANLSRSRNLGLAQASGEIVVFIDDDAVPLRPTWLTAYRAHFAMATRCGAAGALVIDPLGRVEFDRGRTSEYAEQCDDGVIPGSGARTLNGVMGCNCAMRASALREIGGFDERLAYYLDETDVCFRLAARGYDIDFVNDNEVVHFSAAGPFRRDPIRKRWRTIMRSDTYFCMRHGSDPLPHRMKTIVRLLRWKHFFYLLLHVRPRPPFRREQIVRDALLSMVGMAEGFWHGLLPARGRHATRADPAPDWLRFGAPQPKRKLRIGLISRTLPGGGRYGGPGQHSDTLAKALYGRGHAVHLFCLDERPSTGWIDFRIHAAPPAVEDSRFYRAELPSVSQRLSTAHAYLMMIEQLGRAGQPLDMVLASNWDLEALAVIRAGTCPTALYIVTPLAMNLEMQLPGFDRSEDLELWNSLDRWQIQNAAMTLAPSRAVLSTYDRLLGLAEASLPRLSVVPLGVERTFLPPLPRPGRRYRLLFVGRLEKRKGIQVLLAVLPTLLADFKDWDCHIVGDDALPFADGVPIKQTFLSRSRRGSWKDRVVFHGYSTQDQLHVQYRHCDILVVPAIYESFGLVYQEAMQYAKPVVACRAGGMPETVADEVEGLLVPPDDARALEQALRRLMGDAILRARLGKAGAERVALKDNAELFAARVESHIVEFLDLPRERKRAVGDEPDVKNTTAISSGFGEDKAKSATVV
jgi:glycogen(starch) synthase